MLPAGHRPLIYRNRAGGAGFAGFLNAAFEVGAGIVLYYVRQVVVTHFEDLRADILADSIANAKAFINFRFHVDFLGFLSIVLLIFFNYG